MAIPSFKKNFDIMWVTEPRIVPGMIEYLMEQKISCNNYQGIQEQI